MDEYRQITRKGSPPYFARGLARLTRSPWRAVVSARLGGISTGALSNLLPTKSIGRRSARRSTTRPLRRPTRPPSASSRASPTPSSAAAPPAALASPRCSTSSARRSARSRSSAPPDVSMVVTRPLAGTGSTSQASHPGRRASSERRAGPSKPAGRTESIPRDPLSSGGQGGVGLSVTAVTKTASPCPVGSSQYAPHG